MLVNDCYGRWILWKFMLKQSGRLTIEIEYILRLFYQLLSMVKVSLGEVLE